MCLATFQLWKLFQGKTCFWIRSGADGKSNHGLIHMKTRILTSKIICLQLLNGVNSIRGDHMLLVIDSGKLLQHIQKKGGGSTKQIRGLTCDNPSVLQLHGSSRSTSFFLSFQGSRTTLRSSSVACACFRRSSIL